MTIDSAPLGGTGPRNIPRLTLEALRSYLVSVEKRLKYVEKNRTPAPLPMSSVSNAANMQQAGHGHAPVFSDTIGAYTPSPVLATLLFHMPGDLQALTSDPLHARYPCNAIGVSANLSTYASNCTFLVKLNGSTIATVTMTSASTGFIGISGNPAVVAYTDLVTVETTSIGTGNAGLVVHVELGVVIGGSTPGP